VSLQANGQDIIENTVTVMETMEIVAVFAKQQFPVSFTKPANGSLKVFKETTEIQSDTPVEYGTKLRVEAIPDTGYELVSLQANGQDIIENRVTVNGCDGDRGRFRETAVPGQFHEARQRHAQGVQGDDRTSIGHTSRVRDQTACRSHPDMGYKLVSLQANGQAITNDTVTVTGVTEIKALFERWVSTDNYRIKVTNAACRVAMMAK